MPDPQGVLSDAEKKKIVDWLTEKKSSDSHCPMCNHDQWTIGSHLVITPIFTNFLTAGYGFPAVMLFCARCAYIRTHLAIPMGLVELPKTEPQKAQEAPTGKGA